MGKGQSQIYTIPVSAEHFQAVKANQMLFQVCQDDERLSMGDHLVLQEIGAERGLSGAVIACVITYKQPGGALGIEPSEHAVYVEQTERERDVAVLPTGPTTDLA